MLISLFTGFQIDLIANMGDPCHNGILGFTKLRTSGLTSTKVFSPLTFVSKTFQDSLRSDLDLPSANLHKKTRVLVLIAISGC